MVLEPNTHFRLQKFQEDLRTTGDPWLIKSSEWIAAGYSAT